MGYFGNAEDNHVAMVFDLVGSFLSLCGSVFILVIYYKFPVLQNFAYKMVVYLSLSDLIMSTAKLMTIFRITEVQNQDEDDYLCYTQAFLINFGGLSSILWTTCISYAMKVSVVSGKTEVPEDYENKFLAYAFGVPFVASILPFYTQTIGHTGRFCWVKMTPESYSSAFLGLLEFYIPLWIAIFYNHNAYKSIVKHLSDSMSESTEKKIAERLSIYPKILVICWFFPTINRIWSIFFGPSALLNILHAFFGSWQGFLNAIAYGMTDSVKEILRSRNWCPYFLGTNQQILVDENEMNESLLSATEMIELNSPDLVLKTSDKKPRKSDLEIQEMLRTGALYS